jgi:hypothetical protein
MVCCFLVRSGFVVFGGLTMMLGGLIVMMCCFLVVFVDFWHSYLPVNRSLTILRRGVLEYRRSAYVHACSFRHPSAVRALRIGRIDFLHFSNTNFKFKHVGNAHGADSLDFIAADISMSLEQLPRVFDGR